jgi:DNA-binding LytR/AlgR family response regulator
VAGGLEMKVEVSIDKNQKEPKIIIVTCEITDSIKDLTRYLSLNYADKINGYSEQGVEIIKECDIIRIYGEHQKVFCETLSGKYILHSRLYELENKLDSRMFVRISNSEIVNAKRILRLDASITGTIGVYLEGNIKTFSSRRYVKKIREIFGM